MNHKSIFFLAFQIPIEWIVIFIICHSNRRQLPFSMLALDSMERLQWFRRRHLAMRRLQHKLQQCKDKRYVGHDLHLIHPTRQRLYVTLDCQSLQADGNKFILSFLRAFPIVGRCYQKEKQFLHRREGWWLHILVVLFAHDFCLLRNQIRIPSAMQTAYTDEWAKTTDV